MFRKKLGFWAPIAVVAVALLVLAVSAGSVDAARSGRGGGKPGGGSSATATLSVSPNPPTAGVGFAVSGTGFKPNAAVNFFQGSYAVYAMADATGYAETSWTIALPGTYTIGACQFTSKGCQQVGSITFNVIQ